MAAHGTAPSAMAKSGVLAMTRELGVLKVPAGRHDLAITAVKIPPGQELIRFIGVTLTPVNRQ